MDVEELYKKERSRVLHYIARKKREGYYVGDIKVPSIPKKIGEGSVRRLQKFTPEKMRKGIYYISATGEVAPLSNNKAVKQLKYEDYHEGGIYAMSVLNNFSNEVEQLGNRRADRMVNEWLSSWIMRDGAELVAEALEKAANSGIKLEVTEYGSDRRISETVIRFARETFRLSGEYSEGYIEDLVEEMEESFYTL